MTAGWHAITPETHDSVDFASPSNLSPPKGTCVYLSLRRVTIAGVCDAKSLPSSDADVPEVGSNLLLAARARRIHESRV